MCNEHRFEGSQDSEAVWQEGLEIPVAHKGDAAAAIKMGEDGCVRSWVFSDLHLRPGGSEAIESFVDLARKERPSLIIGLGDVLELLWYTFDELMEDKESARTVGKMKALAETIETWWVPGNHDPDLESHQGELEPIRVMPDMVKLEGVRFEHGHRVDPLTRCLWNPITQSVWWSPTVFRDLCRLCPPLHRLFYPTPWEIKNKDEEGWKWYCAAYEAFYEVQAQRDGEHYVHGHTHQPFIMEMMGGLCLGNSGDMVDSRTFLDISEGRMSLRSVKEE